MCWCLTRKATDNHRVFSPSTFSGVQTSSPSRPGRFTPPIADLPGSLHPSLLLGRDRVTIFARTLQLFNRSPQALPRRSFSSTPPSSPSLNASRTNSPLGDSPRTVSADHHRLKMAFNLVQSHSGAELGPELSDVFTDVCIPYKLDP